MELLFYSAVMLHSIWLVNQKYIWKSNHLNHLKDCNFIEMQLGLHSKRQIKIYNTQFTFNAWLSLSDSKTASHFLDNFPFWLIALHSVIKKSCFNQMKCMTESKL